ncbi:hypothetical protein ACWGJX_46720 [Streptomyces sp. NPDC054775]
MNHPAGTPPDAARQAVHQSAVERAPSEPRSAPTSQHPAAPPYPAHHPAHPLTTIASSPYGRQGANIRPGFDPVASRLWETSTPDHRYGVENSLAQRAPDAHRDAASLFASPTEPGARNPEATTGPEARTTLLDLDTHLLSPQRIGSLRNEVNLELARLGWPHGPVEMNTVLLHMRDLVPAWRHRNERDVATRIAGTIAGHGHPPALPGGAIGIEVEFPSAKIISEDSIEHGTGLFRNSELSLMTESTVAGERKFLEVAGRPMAVLPGEENRTNSDAFFASLEGIQSKIRHTGEMGSMFSKADGFIATKIGARARIVNESSTVNSVMSSQYTVGVPMSTLDEVLLFAKNNSSSAGLRELDSIEAGLDFGTQVAARYLSERSLGRELSASRFAVEAIDDPDVRALRNFAALLFTQAIAPVHRAAESAGEPVGWAKSHMVVASRHSPHVLRQTLSRDSKKFLDRNVGYVLNLFQSYASQVIRPGVSIDPLSTRIRKKTHTVFEYLTSALMSSPWVKVDQREMAIETSFDDLDSNADAHGKNRLDHPLVLLELRDIFAPVNHWVAELRRDYERLRRVAADSYTRATERAALVESHHARQRVQILRASDRPEVQALDEVLRGNAHLNLRLASLGRSRQANWLSRDRIPDLVDLVQRFPLSPDVDPATLEKSEKAADALEKFRARLEENGTEFNIRHYSARTADERRVAMRDAEIWAETTRATNALLRELAPQAIRPVPPRVMYRWREATPSRGRSAAMRRVDRAVGAAIIRPNNRTVSRGFS